jgi:hypothetical protein
LVRRGVDKGEVIESIVSRIRSQAETSEQYELASERDFSAKEILARGWLGKGWKRLWLFALRLDSGELIIVAEGGFAADGAVMPDLSGFHPNWESDVYHLDLTSFLDSALARWGASREHTPTIGT